MGLGRPGAAGADAVAAPARLRRGGPGHRRDAPGGSSPFEILPNLTAIIASGFVGTVIFAVMSEITLAFIGISAISDWNWGTILFWAQSQQALAQGAWWWFVPAGLAIALLGTALSLINFGIDEFVSPRLRSSGTDPGQDRRRPHGPDAGRLHPGPGATTADRRGRPRVVTADAKEDARMSEPVLEIKNLNVDYGLGDEAVQRGPRRQPRPCTAARCSAWPARAAAASRPWRTA